MDAPLGSVVGSGDSVSAGDSGTVSVPGASDSISDVSGSAGCSTCASDAVSGCAVAVPPPHAVSASSIPSKAAAIFVFTLLCVIISLFMFLSSSSFWSYFRDAAHNPPCVGVYKQKGVPHRSAERQRPCRRRDKAEYHAVPVSAECRQAATYLAYPSIRLHSDRLAGLFTLFHVPQKRLQLTPYSIMVTV